MRASPDGGDAAVSLGLLALMLLLALLLWLSWLLFRLARLVARRLWFGSLKRAQETAQTLSGVREREVELISRGIDPKTARRHSQANRRRQVPADQDFNRKGLPAPSPQCSGA